jgi:hypothetical protein
MELGLYAGGWGELQHGLEQGGSGSLEVVAEEGHGALLRSRSVASKMAKKREKKVDDEGEFKLCN